MSDGSLYLSSRERFSVTLHTLSWLPAVRWQTPESLPPVAAGGSCRFYGKPPLYSLWEESACWSEYWLETDATPPEARHCKHMLTYRFNIRVVFTGNSNHAPAMEASFTNSYLWPAIGDWCCFYYDILLSVKYYTQYTFFPFKNIYVT